MTESNVRLLPCPFCGGSNIEPDGWASKETTGPACSDCQASVGGISWSPEQNIAAWNRRAPALVGVKPLEWQGSGWPKVANHSLGQYQIWSDFEVFRDGHILQTDGLSYEFAQAAAQADYEARILSALSPGKE